MLGVSRAGRRSARAKATPPSQAAVATAPRQWKQAAVIALLRQPEGVTVAEVRGDDRMGAAHRPGSLLRRTEAFLLSGYWHLVGAFFVSCAARPRD